MIGIKGGADVGSGNDLLSVISKDKVGEDVALSLGNANPSSTLLTTFRGINSIGLIENRFTPMELEKHRNISLDVRSGFKRGDATKGVRGHVVEKEDHVEEAEKPEGGRCPGMIHDGAGEAFNITNFTFSKMLVLMLNLTLEVLDLVETESAVDTGTNFDFGIVGEKAIGSTMFTDEVL
jgi:hypothetical protein